jgi:hypothetical protein
LLLEGEAPDRIATQIELALLLDGQLVVKFTKQQTDAALTYRDR